MDNGFSKAEQRIRAWTSGPLDLSNLGLETVPDSIGQLTSLTQLALSGNQLTTVPDSIGQLTSLTQLTLSGNQLATVPDSIGQLTSLTELYLSGNLLATVPDSIGQLTSLTTLYLHDNLLATVPNSIGQLTSLTTLYLHNNQLTTVPDSIGQLTSLTTLYLHDNQLATVPDSISQLTSLTTLYLDGNQLTTVPDSIGRLTSLTRLDLHDNLLTTVPDSISQLTSLTTLTLHDNQLKTVPDSIVQLTSLTELYLHDNQLTTVPDSIGQLTSLTTLTLYNNQLTTVPDSITQLTSLTTLRLYNNQLTTVPDSIGRLTSLTTLRLHDNQLTTVPDSITQLTSLTQLYLHDNQLTTLPDSIGQLTSLTQLTRYNNQLTTAPDSIGQLTSLTELRLYNNELTTVPDSITQLTSLTQLYLHDNQLTTLPDSIGRLTSLTRLDLHDNLLATVPDSIGQLTSLTQLYLSGNQLTTVPDSITQLTSLTQLYLHNNQLTTVPDSITQLTSLTTLYLHNNQLTTVPDSISQLTSLTELTLHNNPVSDSVPGSVLEGRPADVIRYLLDLRQDEEPLNELKLLILGRGGAGKSSIKDRLLKDEFDPDRLETPGVDIDRWPFDIETSTVQLNVWDFAGQEIAHATHRFFLTERSVYFVVLDARADTQDADAEYWCRIATAFGGDSPIIVVLNKQDLKAFDVDRNRLKDDFPNIAAFVKTDCVTRAGIDELQHCLQDVVGSHTALSDRFPQAWHHLKGHFADVEQLPDYQTLAEFRATCANLGEDNPNRQSTLARTLHALGLIIHYGDDPRLRDTAVLNPEWVTSSVYKLLRAREGADGDDGVLAFEDAQHVLEREEPEQVHYLINLMRRFELCFPIDGDQSWLVPDLLPKYQPELDPTWRTTTEAVRLQYSYRFLPEGLIAQFITRLHPLTEDQIRWRYGTVLEMEGASGLVQADTRERQVEVTVVGDDGPRQRLASLIRSQLGQLHGQIRGLTVGQKVELSQHTGVFTSVTTLEKDEASGAPISAAATDEGTVAVDQTSELNRISSPEARRTDLQRLSAFVSYSHSDSKMLEKLKVNLRVMEAQGYLSTWTDSRILPSGRWDDEIQQELEQADIIIFLVSSNMLASDYIRNVELKRALERRRSNETELVGVILEDCSWKAEAFAEYQVILGGKPANQHKPQRNAFYQVEKALQKLIDSMRNTGERIAPVEPGVLDVRERPDPE